MSPDEEERAALRLQLDDLSRQLLERGGWRVSGWALVAEVQRINPDVAAEGLEPLGFSARYVLGPGTSAAGMAGLLDALRVLLRGIVAHEFASGDPDPE